MGGGRGVWEVLDMTRQGRGVEVEIDLNRYGTNGMSKTSAGSVVQKIRTGGF